MAERPVALPPKIREPMRHVTAIPTTHVTAIPTTTTAVRKVRHHDCHSRRIRGGPTGFRGSMPSVRACRYVLAQLWHPTRLVSPITGPPQLAEHSARRWCLCALGRRFALIL